MATKTIKTVKATTLHIRAAATSDPQEIYGYAHRLDFGDDNTERNLREAFTLYKWAAKLGHPGAMVAVGDIYRMGHALGKDYGIRKSDERALQWFRRAADLHSPAAHFNLGLMYEFGHGVQTCYSTAAKHYRIAAEQGHPAAQRNLAYLYIDGRPGVPKDRDAGITWLHRVHNQQVSVGETLARVCGWDDDDDEE